MDTPSLTEIDAWLDRNVNPTGNERRDTPEWVLFIAASTAINKLRAMLAAETERAEKAEAATRTVQNAATTLHKCRDSELTHLRENATYDHRLRAQHESMLEHEAQMTEALLISESALTTAQAEIATLKRELDEARARTKQLEFAESLRNLLLTEERDEARALVKIETIRRLHELVEWLQSDPDNIHFLPVEEVDVLRKWLKENPNKINGD